MQRLILAAAILIYTMCSHGQENFHQYEYPGYDDMPQIRGTAFTVHQKDRPQPPRIIPAESGKTVGSSAPSDATVLFDGSTLEHFQENGWQISDGHLIAGEGNLATKASFGDCQLHVEWRAPSPPQGEPGNMGNSGIFFMGLYELQIYDSYSSKIYADGSAAAIYGQTPPMVNVCRAPGQWQTYDVIFTAPRFNGEDVIEPAAITVFHNGVAVHNKTEIFGPTRHKTSKPYKFHGAQLPLVFQGHGCPVEFRNIWIRDLAAESIYQPTWESLSTHNIEPEWFKDAKFGIYFHWGVYSVPAFDNEWYPSWMYYPDREGWGSEVYAYHQKNYGADFDYHDFVPMFKAEHFDAAEWADLFQNAGATFAGPVAQHHDGFAMWDSEINPWNVADMGPKNDITGKLLAELKKRDMKTIATFHHARNLQRNAADTCLWAGNGKVGWDSHYPYHPDLVTSTTDEKLKYLYGNIDSTEFNARWMGQVNEVVDKYAPDLIWFDSWLDLIPENIRQEMLAHHYNTGVHRGQEPIAFHKQEDLPDSVALVDIEQGGKTEISEKYWLTDITISNGSWCYTNGLKYKKADLIIRNMIDVWSKKGIVLLNVSPKADGTIPQGQQDVLNTIGDWIKNHKEAVYETRAHSVFGYGIAEFEKGHFGGQSATMEYTKDDVRFAVSKDGKSLFVYLLGLPDAKTELKLEYIFESNEGQEIANVSVVGSGVDLQWKKSDDKLVVDLPAASAMNEIATVLKVAFK